MIIAVNLKQAARTSRGFHKTLVLVFRSFDKRKRLAPGASSRVGVYNEQRSQDIGTIINI